MSSRKSLKAKSSGKGHDGWRPVGVRDQAGLIQGLDLFQSCVAEAVRRAGGQGEKDKRNVLANALVTVMKQDAMNGAGYAFPSQALADHFDAKDVADTFASLARVYSQEGARLQSIRAFTLRAPVVCFVRYAGDGKRRLAMFQLWAQSDPIRFGPEFLPPFFLRYPIRYTVEDAPADAQTEQARNPVPPIRVAERPQSDRPAAVPLELELVPLEAPGPVVSVAEPRQIDQPLVLELVPLGTPGPSAVDAARCVQSRDPGSFVDAEVVGDELPTPLEVRLRRLALALRACVYVYLGTSLYDGALGAVRTLQYAHECLDVRGHANLEPADLRRELLAGKEVRCSVQASAAPAVRD